MLLILALVGCIDDELDDPEGEASSAAIIEHGDPCPGGEAVAEEAGRTRTPSRGPGTPPRPLEPTHEQCYACCNWNVDNVWGERCRRIPWRDERKRC